MTILTCAALLANGAAAAPPAENEPTPTPKNEAPSPQAEQAAAEDGAVQDSSRRRVGREQDAAGRAALLGNRAIVEQKMVHLVHLRRERGYLAETEPSLDAAVNEGFARLTGYYTDGCYVAADCEIAHLIALLEAPTGTEVSQRSGCRALRRVERPLRPLEQAEPQAPRRIGVSRASVTRRWSHARRQMRDHTILPSDLPVEAQAAIPALRRAMAEGDYCMAQEYLRVLEAAVEDYRLSESQRPLSSQH